MLLSVKSALPAGKVALWERAADHPGGEIFIADEAVHQVANTPAVMGAIARNVLVIVPAGEAEAEFDASALGRMTVSDILAAVDDGRMSAAAALAAEQAGKARKSLIDALQARLQEESEL